MGASPTEMTRKRPPVVNNAPVRVFVFMARCVIPAALIALVSIAVSRGQSPCPAVNFLNPQPISLTTATTKTVLVRQPDGSYTGIEMSNVSPYRVLSTTPHMERQFAACVGHALPPVAKPASAAAPNSSGQREAWAVLNNGNYVHVTLGLDLVVFDPKFNLVSEIRFPPPPTTGKIKNNYTSVALADVNGDGKLDVIAEYE